MYNISDSDEDNSSSDDEGQSTSSSSSKAKLGRSSSTSHLHNSHCQQPGRNNKHTTGDEDSDQSNSDGDDDNYEDGEGDNYYDNDKENKVGQCKARRQAQQTRGSITKLVLNKALLSATNKNISSKLLDPDNHTNKPNLPQFSRSSVGGSKYLLTCHPNQPDIEDLIFESRFESGNLAKAVKITSGYYELYLRPDMYTNRHTQWFYFRVSNTRKNVNYR